MKPNWSIAILAILAVIVGISCNRRPTDPDDIRPGRVVMELYSDSTPRAVVFYKLDETGRMTDEKIREVNYYPNKQKYVEANFKNGVRHGEWKSYFQSGQLQSEQYYINGQSDSVYKVFHENGKPYIEGHFKDGQCTGTWLFYDNNGTLRNRRIADDNTECCQGCRRCTAVRMHRKTQP
jgi:hypothetical protein